MPSYAVIIAYIIMCTFSIFHSKQAAALEAEYNPNAKALRMFSGAGLLVAQIYPIYYVIYGDVWYWGVIIYLVGLVVGALVFGIVLAFLPATVRAGVVLLGFIGIPASIVGLIFFSV